MVPTSAGEAQVWTDPYICICRVVDFAAPRAKTDYFSRSEVSAGST